MEDILHGFGFRVKDAKTTSFLQYRAYGMWVFRGSGSDFRPVIWYNLDYGDLHKGTHNSENSPMVRCKINSANTTFLPIPALASRQQSALKPSAVTCSSCRIQGYYLFTAGPRIAELFQEIPGSLQQKRRLGHGGVGVLAAKFSAREVLKGLGVKL